jgi:hypothetical protein
MESQFASRWGSRRWNFMHNPFDDVHHDWNGPPPGSVNRAVRMRSDTAFLAGAACRITIDLCFKNLVERCQACRYNEWRDFDMIPDARLPVAREVEMLAANGSSVI